MRRTTQFVMKSIVICLLLLAFQTNAWCYDYVAPDTAWTKTHGSTENERGFCIQLIDGGFIATGFTDSYGSGGEDLWVLEFDDDGDLSWSEEYGGSDDDVGTQIHENWIGNYIVSGLTESYGAGDMDAWILEIETDGDSVWSQTYGTSINEIANAIAPLSDSCYVFAGVKSYTGGNSGSYWLKKIDEDGDNLWDRTYSSSWLDWAPGVQEIDGCMDIISTGYYHVAQDDIDGNMRKHESDGDQIWNQYYGGGSEEHDNFGELDQCYDVGFVSCGRYWEGVTPAWSKTSLLRVDDEGDEIWYYAYGDQSDMDRGHCIRQTIDGGFIVAGYRDDSEILLIKTDAGGEKEWEVTEDFGDIDEDKARWIEQLADGSYILTGFTRSIGAGGEDLLLMKYEKPDLLLFMVVDDPPVVIPSIGGSFDYDVTVINNTGSTIPFKYWNEGTHLVTSSTFGAENVRDSVRIAAGDTVSRSLTKSISAGTDAGWWCWQAIVHDYPDSNYYHSTFLFYKEPSESVVGGSDDALIASANPMDYSLSNPYPNPFNPITEIKYSLPEACPVQLTIYNTSGREITTLVRGVKEAGSHAAVFNGSNLASGIYIARFEAGNYHAIQKLILMK